MTEFTLSPIEVACGVTMDDVRRVRADAYVMHDKRSVAIGRNTPPALAGAAARMALGGPVEFDALNIWGQPLYRLASTVLPNGVDLTTAPGSARHPSSGAPHG
jgi:hypothetical protein